MAAVMRFFEDRQGVRWGHTSGETLCEPLQSALVWIGETPHRTAGKDGQASSVTRAGDGNRQKTREARSVVALSRVPCGEQGVLVSPPAADQMS